MSRREILIEAECGEVRIATIEDGEVVDLAVERETGGTLVGDIYLGRVERVVGGIDAAFIDIGRGRAGFLPLRDVDRADGAAAGKLTEGETVCVQIKRDAFAEKGPQLSRALSLPGRFLVYVPYGGRVTVSRQIDDEAERDRLSGIARSLALDGEGFVVRTVANGIDAERLEEEADRLRELWDSVVARRASSAPPSAIYSDLGPVERALRDHAQDDVSTIWFETPSTLASARRFCERFWPELVERLCLQDESGGLFEVHAIDEVIETALQRFVRLPSGGGIVIQSTEALTAIDVNSGRFVDGAGPEENALSTNLEAALAAARQIRLRNLGGLIVVDFIHMEEEASWDRVFDVLHDAFLRDRISCRVVGRTEGGLVELIRRRRRPPLAETLLGSCTRCAGEGRTRNPESVAFDVIRAMWRTARNGPAGALVINAHPTVIEVLERVGADEDGPYVRIGREIRHRPMPDYRIEQYDIALAGRRPDDARGEPVEDVLEDETDG